MKTQAVKIVRFEKPRLLTLATKVYELNRAQPTLDASQRARQAVEKTQRVLERATAETLPQVRANSRIMASALRRLGYPAEAAQIEALVGA